MRKDLSLRAFCVGALILLPSAIGTAAQNDGWNLAVTSKLAVRNVCLSPDTPVTSLTLIVWTGNQSSSDAAYFDIGPRAWLLGTRHRRNDYEQYELSFDAQKEQLYVSDILWLRLHKKDALGTDGLMPTFARPWLPTWIELEVNGQLYAYAKNSDILDVSAPVIRFDFSPPDSAVQRFVQSLSLHDETSAVNFLAYAIAFVTTPLFKDKGVSGWKGVGVSEATATGVVYRPPITSTDGLTTIDLKLEQISVGEQERIPDSHGRTRYLRLEYRARGMALPHDGDRVMTHAALRWDTDGAGWYELHPAGKELTILR